jgi:hypothetical protein
MLQLRWAHSSKTRYYSKVATTSFHFVGIKNNIANIYMNFIVEMQVCGYL